MIDMTGEDLDVARVILAPVRADGRAARILVPTREPWEPWHWAVWGAHAAIIGLVFQGRDGSAEIGLAMLRGGLFARQLSTPRRNLA